MLVLRLGSLLKPVKKALFDDHYNSSPTNSTIFAVNHPLFDMQIDKPLIQKLERLARLELSPNERDQIQGDLTKILQMVEKLQELDTEGVEPLIYISEAENVLRKDEVRGELNRDIALQNAPDTDGIYFKVPKVIQK